ncbi:hypothetical protein MBANPS3_004474 [Mucor bainieri]
MFESKCDVCQGCNAVMTLKRNGAKQATVFLSTSKFKESTEVSVLCTGPQLNIAFDTKRKIESMLSESKKSTATISEFWKEHSDILKKLALQDLLDESTVERTLKRKGTHSITEASSSSSAAVAAATTSSTTSSSTSAATPPPEHAKKRLRTRKQKESETEFTNDADLVEADNVFITGCNISVAILIKRAAYKLHERKQSRSYRESAIGLNL